MNVAKALYAEEDLVKLLKQEDQAAFEYLYKQYSGALMGILMRSIQDEEIANDLLQDVFVKIWKNINHYQAERGRLYTWMLNIARNTGIDYLRSKQNKQQSQNQKIDDVVYHLESQSGNIQLTDTIGLKNLLNTLTEDQQLIIEYVYFKGYTQEDASKALQIPLGTIKTKTRAAIAALRKQFNT